MVRFNWKSGLIFTLAFTFMWMAIYLSFGSSIDYGCRYATPHQGACVAYNAASVGVNAYADLFLRVFAPACVGGAGPDSCIAPALLIMLGTFLVTGFVLGGFLFRETKKPDPTAVPSMAKPDAPAPG